MFTLPGTFPNDVSSADIDFVSSLFDAVERFEDDAARCESSDPALSERLLDRALELSERAGMLLAALGGKLQVA